MARIACVMCAVAAALCATAAAVEQGEPPVRPLEQASAHIRVACVQMNIPPAWAEENDVLDAYRPHIERAGREDVDLLVFPEYLLGNFKVPDRRTDGLCALARTHNVNIVAGGWEFLGEHPITAPPEPGTFANSALVISREGKVAGRHHKMYAAVAPESPYFWPPKPGERGENIMVPGDGSPIVNLDFGRVAVLTCYDGYFFPSFEVPALKGAEVLVWINGRGGAVEDFIVRAASFMTCTHIVTSNMSVGAGTMICAYPGNIKAWAEEPGDAYITAELNLEFLRTQRKNDRMFHQRRPELNSDLGKAWAPWDAYPQMPFFSYDGAGGQ